MRKRFLSLCVAMALGVGLLTASPAAASYAVASITFPGGNSEFYSPFSGPATVTFTFDGTENAATFELRLRPAGGTAVAKKTVFIDPGNPAVYTSPRSVRFDWPALSVNSPRTYVVAVYRNNNLVGSNSFFLQPRLVSIESARPNPFFPWMIDGYKDQTTIRFNLASTSATEAHLYRATLLGKCCGAEIEAADLGTRIPGTTPEAWQWDGRNASNEPFPKGDYFIKIRAQDLSNVARWSKPLKVSIARTYRATKTKSKTATAYHHVGPITPLVLGGSCIVFRTAEGRLEILCQGGRVSVYWRWGLASSERIERASFVRDNVAGCPPSIRRTGHTKHESSFTMNEDLVGASGNCYLVTARITYSYPAQS